MPEEYYTFKECYSLNEFYTLDKFYGDANVRVARHVAGRLDRQRRGSLCREIL